MKKILALALFLGVALTCACSSPSGIQPTAAAGNTNSVVKPSSDFDEKRAAEILTEKVNQQRDPAGTYELISIGPFFRGETGTTMEVRFQYVFHWGSQRNERTGEAQFKRAENGKWYLTVLGIGRLPIYLDVEIK